MEVTRKPLQKLETTLAGGAIPPCRWHLGDSQAKAVRLDRELEPELEAAK